MAEREYIVTLKNFNDLEGFYHDMQNPGSSTYTPNRAVTYTAHLPTSRNTNYMLTEEEATKLATDPRVLAVELTLGEQGIVVTPMYSQTSNYWDKEASSTPSSNQSKNWGLLRCTETKDRNDWGWASSLGNSPTVSGSISVATSGSNVDVVIVDGHINPNHPEFAVNSDGTGGSRVNQYNWYQHKQAVEGTGNGTYTYGTYNTSNHDHGAHVGGIVAGNTQGWAREANVYNIYPYGGVNSWISYIRAFHAAKSVNVSTGVKNPTITNHSYGLTATCQVANVTSVRFQGTVYTGPFTQQQLANFNIFNDGTSFTFPVRSSSIEADLTDAMADGIICIGAAGNSYFKIATPSATTSDDYNNYLVHSGTTYFYNRGTIAATPGMICVGAIDALALPSSSGFDVSTGQPNEIKLYFSCSGPRIDIWAPGSWVTSAINTNAGIADSRNGSYYLAKKSGTSQASPQVAGVVACWAQDNPTGTQSQAMSYITSNAKTSQLYEYPTSLYSLSNDPNNKAYSLEGAPNKTLYYTREILPQSGGTGGLTITGVTMTGVTIG
jgi:hypothetical protein